MSAKEKVLTFFELHSDIKCMGYENHPVEYGQKIWVNEVESGIVSDYSILAGYSNDENP